MDEREKRSMNKMTENSLRMLMDGMRPGSVEKAVIGLRLNLIESAKATSEAFIKGNVFKLNIYTEPAYQESKRNIEVTLFNKTTNVQAKLLELEEDKNFAQLSFDNRPGKNEIKPFMTGFYRKEILTLAVDTFHKLLVDFESDPYIERQVQMALMAGDSITKNLIDSFLLLADKYSELLLSNLEANDE